MLTVPTIGVTGYDYTDADQRFTLEIWIEKSSLNDVLQPLCEDMGANLVTGIGFSSVTRVVELLSQRAQKPVRIFYLSDFDPAGNSMPHATARQLEFFRDKYAPGVDLKLTPLALTANQVQIHRLPRIPIKDSDRRKDAFESQHGEGAVELDALEALHPGELARIVRDALEPYRDRTLYGRLADSRQEATQRVTDVWHAATVEEHAALAELQAASLAIATTHAEQLATDLAPLQAQLVDLHRRLQQRMETFVVELPERPRPLVTPPDESAYLFDADRDYVAQLKFYKAAQP
jgi:hypothetical protein